MLRSMVKSEPHHDVTHLHPPANVPITYQLPTPYSFLDIAQTRVNRSGSINKVKQQMKVT